MGRFCLAIQHVGQFKGHIALEVRLGTAHYSLHGSIFDFKLYLEFYYDSPAGPTRVFIRDDPDPLPREAFPTAKTNQTTARAILVEISSISILPGEMQAGNGGMTVISG